MKQRLVLTLLHLLFGLMAVGCRTAVNTDAPPEIVYGEDVCDRCNMIISEARFASAYWTTAGDARRFDDIGGMLAHYQETQEDVATLRTPMGFGFAACATQAEANALAFGQDGAIVLDFDTMMAEMETGELDPNPLDNHSHSTQNPVMEESKDGMSGDMNHDDMEHDSNHDG